MSIGTRNSARRARLQEALLFACLGPVAHGHANDWVERCAAVLKLRSRSDSHRREGQYVASSASGAINIPPAELFARVAWRQFGIVSSMLHEYVETQRTAYADAVSDAETDQTPAIPLLTVAHIPTRITESRYALAERLLSLPDIDIHACGGIILIYAVRNNMQWLVKRALLGSGMPHVAIWDALRVAVVLSRIEIFETLLTDSRVRNSILTEDRCECLTLMAASKKAGPAYYESRGGLYRIEYIPYDGFGADIANRVLADGVILTALLAMSHAATPKPQSEPYAWLPMAVSATVRTDNAALLQVIYRQRPDALDNPCSNRFIHELADRAGSTASLATILALLDWNQSRTLSAVAKHVISPDRILWQATMFHRGPVIHALLKYVRGDSGYVGMYLRNFARRSIRGGPNLFIYFEILRDLVTMARSSSGTVSANRNEALFCVLWTVIRDSDLDYLSDAEIINHPLIKSVVHIFTACVDVIFCEPTFPSAFISRLSFESLSESLSGSWCYSAADFMGDFDYSTGPVDIFVQRHKRVVRITESIVHTARFSYLRHHPSTFVPFRDELIAYVGSR